MESFSLDSLWELARQEQSRFKNAIIVARTVYQEGHMDMYRLHFNNIEEVVEYFELEEVGDGIYDEEDLIIVFDYDYLPTGPITYIYSFFLEEPFHAVIDALSDRLIEYDLDVNISRKVLEDGDPGIFLPTIKRPERANGTVLFNEYSHIAKEEPGEIEPGGITSLPINPFERYTGFVGVERELYNVPSFYSLHH